MSVFFKGQIPGFIPSGANHSQANRSGKNDSGDDDSSFLEKAAKALAGLVALTAGGALMSALFRPDNDDDPPPNGSVTLEELSDWTRNKVNSAMSLLREDSEELPPKQRKTLLEDAYRKYAAVAQELDNRADLTSSDNELQNFHSIAISGLSYIGTELTGLGLEPPKVARPQQTVSQQPASNKTIAYGAESSALSDQMSRVAFATGPTVYAESTPVPGSIPPPRRNSVLTRELSSPPSNRAGAVPAISASQAGAVPPEQQNMSLMPQASAQQPAVASGTDWNTLAAGQPQTQTSPAAASGEVIDWNAMTAPAEAKPTKAPKRAQVMQAVPEAITGKVEGVSGWQMFKYYVTFQWSKAREARHAQSVSEAQQIVDANFKVIDANLNAEVQRVHELREQQEALIKQNTELSEENAKLAEGIATSRRELIEVQSTFDTMQAGARQVYGQLKELNNAMELFANDAAQVAAEKAIGIIQPTIDEVVEAYDKMIPQVDEQIKNFEGAVQGIGKRWLERYEQLVEKSWPQLRDEYKGIRRDLEKWGSNERADRAAYTETIEAIRAATQRIHDDTKADVEAYEDRIKKKKDAMETALDEAVGALNREEREAKGKIEGIVAQAVEDSIGEHHQYFTEQFPLHVAQQIRTEIKSDEEKLRKLVTETQQTGEGRLAQLEQLDADLKALMEKYDASTGDRMRTLSTEREQLIQQLTQKQGELDSALRMFKDRYTKQIDALDKARMEKEEEGYTALMSTRRRVEAEQWKEIMSARIDGMQELIKMADELLKLGETAERRFRLQQSEVEQLEMYIAGFEDRTKIPAGVLSELERRERQLNRMLLGKARLANAIGKAVELPPPPGVDDELGNIEQLSRELGEQIRQRMRENSGPIGASAVRSGESATQRAGLDLLKEKLRDKKGKLADVQPQKQVQTPVSGIHERTTEDIPVATPVKIARFTDAKVRDAALKHLGERLVGEKALPASAFYRYLGDDLIGAIGQNSKGLDNNDAYFTDLASRIYHAPQDDEQKAQWPGYARQYVLFTELARTFFGVPDGSEPSYEQINWIQAVALDKNPVTLDDMYQVSAPMEAVLGKGMEGSISSALLLLWARTAAASSPGDFMDGLKQPTDSVKLTDWAMHDARGLYFDILHMQKVYDQLPHINSTARGVLGVTQRLANKIYKENTELIDALRHGLMLKAGQGAMAILDKPEIVTGLAGQLKKDVQGLTGELEGIAASAGLMETLSEADVMEVENIDAREISSNFNAVELMDMASLYEAADFARNLGNLRNSQIDDATFASWHGAIRSITVAVDNVFNVPRPMETGYSPVSRMIQGISAEILGQYGDNIDLNVLSDMINQGSVNATGEYMTADRLNRIIGKSGEWYGSSFIGERLSHYEAKRIPEVFSGFAQIIAEGEERATLAEDIRAMATLVYAFDELQRDRLANGEGALTRANYSEASVRGMVKQKLAEKIAGKFDFGSPAWARALARLDRTVIGSPSGTRGGTGSAAAPSTSTPPASSTPAPGHLASPIEVIDLSAAGQALRSGVTFDSFSAPKISGSLYIRPSVPAFRTTTPHSVRL